VVADTADILAEVVESIAVAERTEPVAAAAHTASMATARRNTAWWVWVARQRMAELVFRVRRDMLSEGPTSPSHLGPLKQWWRW